MKQQNLRCFMVNDRPILNGEDDLDVAGGATNHSMCFIAHSHHRAPSVAVGLDGDHGGDGADVPGPAQVHSGVVTPEIDGEVLREQSKDSVKHEGDGVGLRRGEGRGMGREPVT